MASSVRAASSGPNSNNNTLATTTLDNADGGIPVKANAGADQINAIMEKSNEAATNGNGDDAKERKQSKRLSSCFARSFC